MSEQSEVNNRIDAMAVADATAALPRNSEHANVQLPPPFSARAEDGTPKPEFIPYLDSLAQRDAALADKYGIRQIGEVSVNWDQVGHSQLSDLRPIGSNELNGAQKWAPKVIDAVRVATRKLTGVPDGDSGWQYFLATPVRERERIGNINGIMDAIRYISPRKAVTAAAMSAAVVFTPVFQHPEVGTNEDVDSHEFVYFMDNNGVHIPFDETGQDKDMSRLHAANAAGVAVEDISIENDLLTIASSNVHLMTEDSYYAAYMAALPPESAATENNHEKSEEDPRIVAQEIEVLPQIEQLNAALAEVDINAETIDIANVVNAVKALDDWHKTVDETRPADLPAGYVKFLLPNEAPGISVPYTVAERTAIDERYASPEAVAAQYVTAKMYQDVIKTHFPHLEGDMLRVRDFNSPHHKYHSDGRTVDISGSNGWEVTHYSDGAFTDYQFSDRFDKAFTEEMAMQMAKLHIDGVRVISLMVTSSQTMASEINSRLGSKIMGVSKYHDDHFDVTIDKQFALPTWNPATPWDNTTDLRIGHMGVGLDIAHVKAQHGAFQQWLTENLGAAATEPNQEVVARGGLSANAETVLASIEASEDDKNFIRMMMPIILKVREEGAQINPEVVLAQASLETGFGQNGVLHKKAHNYLGIKAGANWEGPFIIADTQEEYKPGELTPVPDAFRVYANAEECVRDYAAIIASKPFYQDALAQSATPEGYINGLLHELDEEGQIVQKQGEEGVSSYATDSKYAQKIMDVIHEYKFTELISEEINAKNNTVNDSSGESTTTSLAETTTSQPEVLSGNSVPIRVNIDEISWYDIEATLAISKPYLSKAGIENEEEQQAWIRENLKRQDSSSTKGGERYQVSEIELQELLRQGA